MNQNFLQKRTGRGGANADILLKRSRVFSARGEEVTFSGGSVHTSLNRINGRVSPVGSASSLDSNQYRLCLFCCDPLSARVASWLELHRFLTYVITAFWDSPLMSYWGCKVLAFGLIVESLTHSLYINNRPKMAWKRNKGQHLCNDRLNRLVFVGVQQQQ